MADKGAKFKNQNKDEKQPEMREKDGKKEYMDDETNEWVSKNELKKRQTARKKAADAAEKAAKKADVPKKAGAKKDEKLDHLEFVQAILIKKRQKCRRKISTPHPQSFNDFLLFWQNSP